MAGFSSVGEDSACLEPIASKKRDRGLAPPNGRSDAKVHHFKHKADVEASKRTAERFGKKTPSEVLNLTGKAIMPG
jgi:hypothetical protein